MIDEWYLFPDLVDTAARPSDHATVQGYMDALVAPARAQGKDRYFTYITSIEEENAYISSGTAAGFGIRLSYISSRLRVLEAFESGPALAAGIDRGAQILAIGKTAGTMRDVADIVASEGTAGLTAALGPAEAGVRRYLRIAASGGGQESTLAVTKQAFDIDPISDRYGVKVIDEGGTKVGYINLRTFIDTADGQLRAAFGDFRSRGIENLIIDLRYNGGGLVRIAELMGDLMGADKSGQVFSRLTVRDSKAADYNETALFDPPPESIAPMKIAFIGHSGTASASELVANAMIPYLGSNTALVGSNTYGKPVGQFAFDNPDCDDRMRVVVFRTENADGNADYYNGLASTFPITCRASDGIETKLGDPGEPSIANALAFLVTGNNACTAISTGGQSAQSLSKPVMLIPAHPSAAQREMPGLF